MDVARWFGKDNAMKWIIYHNPRCSKSRQALVLLQAQGIEPEIRLYLKQPLTILEIKHLLDKLKLKPSNILRMQEKIIQEQDIDISSESKIKNAIRDYPILLERPIITNGKNAVIGRPPENVKKLF